MEHASTARFDFDVSEFFAFGSPLGLLLAYRKVQVCCTLPKSFKSCVQNTMAADELLDKEMRKLETGIHIIRIVCFEIPTYLYFSFSAIANHGVVSQNSGSSTVSSANVQSVSPHGPHSVSGGAAVVGPLLKSTSCQRVEIPEVPDGRWHLLFID